MLRRTILLSGVLLVGAGAAGLVASELRLRRTYPARGAVPVASAAADRGAHLYQSIGCATCHADDGGGAVYLDAGPVGLAVGSNLTAGRGGVGNRRTDVDLIRAIRDGVRPDGMSLLVMPSEVYAHLTEDDLGAVVAYVRQLPPVDRELPPTRLRPLGRALLALGRLDLRSAPKAARVTTGRPVPSGPTAAYGRYLADIASCRSCHRAGLEGGPMMAPGAPPAPDITSAGLAGWSEADFTTLMRTGRRPDGSELHRIMPWQAYARMTDEELGALWRYLQSPTSSAPPPQPTRRSAGPPR
jgi:cytochrome c553